jgi:hypothetical protein
MSEWVKERKESDEVESALGAVGRKCAGMMYGGRSERAGGRKYVGRGGWLVSARREMQCARAGTSKIVVG